MIQAGGRPTQVVKISGQARMAAFLRYRSADDDAVRKTAQAIKAFHTDIEIALSYLPIRIDQYVR